MAAAASLRSSSNPIAACYREILDIDPGLTAAEKRTLRAEIAALEGERPAGARGKSADVSSPAAATSAAAAAARAETASSPAKDGSAAAKPRLSRAEQSRMNGARSRGPTSMEGKLASCMNAFQHGLRARPGLLPDEDPAAFAAFVDDVFRELSPSSALQRQLVQRAAEMAWRLQRLPLIERQVLSDAADASGTPFYGSSGIDDLLVRSLGVEKDGVLVRLQRYGTRIERSLHACIRELRSLQKAAQHLPAAETPAVRSAMGATATGAVGTATSGHPITPPSTQPTIHDRGRTSAAQHAIRQASDGVVASSGSFGTNTGSGSLGAAVGAAGTGVTKGAGAVSAVVSASPVLLAVPLTPAGSDGMRLSGSFGAAAVMPMPVTAFAAQPLTTPPSGTEAAISGSIGHTAQTASHASKAARGQTPADWPKGNDLLPPATFAVG